MVQTSTSVKVNEQTEGAMEIKSHDPVLFTEKSTHETKTHGPVQFTEKSIPESLKDTLHASLKTGMLFIIYKCRCGRHAR